MCCNKYSKTINYKFFIIVISFIVFSLCYSQHDLFGGIKSYDYDNIAEGILYQNNPMLEDSLMTRCGGGGC